MNNHLAGRDPMVYCIFDSGIPRIVRPGIHFQAERQGICKSLAIMRFKQISELIQYSYLCEWLSEKPEKLSLLTTSPVFYRDVAVIGWTISTRLRSFSTSPFAIRFDHNLREHPISFLIIAIILSRKNYMKGGC